MDQMIFESLNSDFGGVTKGVYQPLFCDQALSNVKSENLEILNQPLIRVASTPLLQERGRQRNGSFPQLSSATYPSYPYIYTKSIEREKREGCALSVKFSDIGVGTGRTGRRSIKERGDLCFK